MEGVVQVFIKLTTGKTLQMDVDPSAQSCLELKHKITATLLEAKEQSPEAHQQILSFSATMLEDTRKLSDYNIQHDSVIYVSIKAVAVDRLDFDSCRQCLCASVSPCILPCGHSLCKFCIPPDAVVCPVSGCNSSLGDSTRETLPPNWIAFQFSDPKPQSKEQEKQCQACLLNETQTAAAFWCESCSITGSELEFYCTSCAASEHSSLNTKKHTRIPIEKLSLAFPSCPKHKLPEDSFCFNDNVFVCYKCRDTDHTAHGHTTKLVQTCEQEIRNELLAAVGSLTDFTIFNRKKNILNKSKQQKEDEISSLLQKIEILKHDIETIQSKIKQIDLNSEKSVLASRVFVKSIEEYPIIDLVQKFNLMKTRVGETLKLLALEKVFVSIKATYQFKSKFGSQGATEGRFDYPYGIALAEDGTVLVSDKNNHRIQVFERSGAFKSSFGGRGVGPGSFASPTGIIFDAEGNLVVIDQGNNRIQVFDATYQFKYMFGTEGSGDGQFNTPNGIALDNIGNLVIADDNHGIQVFTSTGTFLRKFGTSGQAPGSLRYPIGCAVSRESGNIYVCDHGNNRVQIFDDQGKFLRGFGTKGREEGQFANPWGLAVDDLGNIIVADQGNHRLQVFSPEGEFIASIGTKGNGDGQIDCPRTPIIDQEGNIWLTDRGNNRVVMFGELLLKDTD